MHGTFLNFGCFFLHTIGNMVKFNVHIRAGTAIILHGDWDPTHHEESLGKS